MRFAKTPLAFALSFATLLLIASSVSAAAPDGTGPWADSVVSSSQGLMKNGSAVPVSRSDVTATLGVAENDTVDSSFFSLGFGGNIVLGFDNGISSGVFIVEATNPDYPLEQATVEVSSDGVTWSSAGTVTQDGSVNVPETVVCAKFVRITDISDPEIMLEDTADGYDVDGVQALGESCGGPTPTPTATPTASNTPGPTTSSSSPPSTNNVCTSTGITTIPTIIEARRTSPTSIFVSWGPFAGLNDFIVQYGYQNGVWLFNTKVNGFSTTINDLPANQSIWIQVAATDNCATGSYGAAVLVGGTPITNSPGFPNTGNPLVPGFPNTGLSRLAPLTSLFHSVDRLIQSLSSYFSYLFNLPPSP